MPDKNTLSLLPNVRVMFEKRHDPEAEFELAVRALIDGIYASLSKP